MAKSSRASSRKANNQRLKARVFGPVETERNARLSAKLLELAAAPKLKPESEEAMEIVDTDAANATTTTTADKSDNAEGEGEDVADEIPMEIDTAKSTTISSKSGAAKKGRVEKRRKTSKIVFPKYGDKNKKKRKH
ncbi:hypothetical protein F4777DRAFT_574498 [Nemania sp. FL0916]|nr:hypothetical protein F4777DRAFT_574498 [Nemania sp. FL0916]